jgi:hypothetical protein
MFALEKSKLPFGLANGKLEESPEGARLTITLFKKPHNEQLAPPPVICRV